MKDDLISILSEAEKYGFTKQERHEVAIRYRNAQEEFLRLTGYNYAINDLYAHAALKARSYIARKIDLMHSQADGTP